MPEEFSVPSLGAEAQQVIEVYREFAGTVYRVQDAGERADAGNLFATIAAAMNSASRNLHAIDMIHLLATAAGAAAGQCLLHNFGEPTADGELFATLIGAYRNAQQKTLDDAGARPH